jgi:hypothetical protein
MVQNTDTRANEVIDTLGKLGAQIAMESAAEYIRKNKPQINTDKLMASLRNRCKDAIIEAANDAREATAAGMHEVAQATFTVTMINAGIMAVKDLEA